MAAEQMLLRLAVKAVRKLAEPATQDKLVKRLGAYPEVPGLSWGQRRRLKRVIGSDAGANALMDQDEAGARALSVVIAGEVLREPESDRSKALADALIAEFPACVAGPEQANLVAYQLRLIRETQKAIGDQIGGVDLTVAHVAASIHEVRRVLEIRDPVRLDPEVLLKGPLAGLDLQPAYQEVRQLALDDPAAAAGRLSLIIGRIEANNYTRLARSFRRERADLLARAGELVAAADAWLPMVDDYLTGGYGSGVRDAADSWRAIATLDGAPEWLGYRGAVVPMLEGWLNFDYHASEPMNWALCTADANDPAATTWLAYAAEACLVEDYASGVDDVRDRLMEAANSVGSLMGIRLKLAIADAAGDESLWRQLLNDATPGSPKYSTEHSALIHARRARKLFWDGDLEQSVTEFRFAADLASRSRCWEDAANWTASARHILHQTGVVNVGESDALEQQEAALRSAGPGTLLEHALDSRDAALLTLIQVEAPGDVAARATDRSLRRYLQRSIVLAELNNERAAHLLLGRLSLREDQASSAVEHFIVAGEVLEAGNAAAKLDRYHDCSDWSASPALNTRTAALHAASQEADLIPDDRVWQWARIALDEAKSRVATNLDPLSCLPAYAILAGLAARLPDELIAESLDEVDHLLPRAEGPDRPSDEQVARILIGLGLHNNTHRAAIADRIATAFDLADPVASIVVENARSLSVALSTIKDRLHMLLTPASASRHAQVLNAGLALIEIGEQSLESVAVAEDFVCKELKIAAGEGVKAPLAGAQRSAVIARCLPAGRQDELARAFADKALDGTGSELTRGNYATACEIMGSYLPSHIRDDLFDKLFPLRAVRSEDVRSSSKFDRFLSSFWYLADTEPATAAEFHELLIEADRTAYPKGHLRRCALRALAVLATNHDRRERLWKAAQQNTVSGDPADVLNVGDVGYALSMSGFATYLPWEAMANSPAAEMRKLAAKLIPLTSGLNFELVSNLARDAVPDVRQELAVSLSNLDMNRLSGSDAEHMAIALAILLKDPSYRVRHDANSVEDTATR
jgi:hypothetical protein